MIKIRFSTKSHKKALVIWNIALSILISLGVTLPTTALTRDQLEFYAQNGIFFYNPDNTVGINSTTCISGSNTNYAGDQVWTSEQMELINNNKFAYQAAADTYGFPWQILAVIHSTESSLSRKNPNEDGLYQIIHDEWHDETFTTGKVLNDEEFLATTMVAAKFIAENKASGLNLNTADGVKELFLRYNGTGGGHYKAKAEALGYTETYEGSPYVMNRYDAQRDPTHPEGMNPAWPGMYATDGVYDPTFTWTGFGAYTKYVALGGSGDDGCFFYTAGGYTIPYGANGMDENDAVELMKKYRDRVHFNGDPSKGNYANQLKAHNQQLINDYGLTSNKCSGGVAYNCVSFSRYFVNMYTGQSSNMIRDSLGNGIDVASGLLSYPEFHECGPTAYAVFSGTGSGDEGHTGVILGINTATDEVVTGEAACGSGEAGIKVVIYSLPSFTQRYSKFACPTSVNLSIDEGYNVQFPELYNDPISVVRY